MDLPPGNPPRVGSLSRKLVQRDLGMNEESQSTVQMLEDECGAPNHKPHDEWIELWHSVVNIQLKYLNVVTKSAFIGLIGLPSGLPHFRSNFFLRWSQDIAAGGWETHLTSQEIAFYGLFSKRWASCTYLTCPILLRQLVPVSWKQIPCTTPQTKPPAMPWLSEKHRWKSRERPQGTTWLLPSKAPLISFLVRK